MAGGDLPRPRPPAAPSTAWLVTFTDLVALMLTFFVMLFSMSSVKVDRYKEMTDALSQTLNPARAVTVKIPAAEYNISSAVRRRAVNLDYLHAVFEQKVAESTLLRSGQLTLMDDRLVISLPGVLLFGESGAVLGDRAQERLFVLGGILRQVENKVTVHAYVPSESDRGQYESVWELSLARAIAVANALTRSGYRDELVIYGYGDSRGDLFARLAPQTSAQLARRVDIVINSVAAAE